MLPDREHLELTLPEVGAGYQDLDEFDRGFSMGLAHRGLTDYRLAALLLAALSGFIVGALVMWVIR